VIPVAVIRPIAERWLAEYDSPESAFRSLGLASGLTADAWRKRLSDTPAGWWPRTQLAEVEVDAFLTAAGLGYLWHEPPLNEHSPVLIGLRCEDCNKPIEADDYFPLDLMRPDPSATRWVWDSTKHKLVFRPRNARAGGRRFRKVDLCRRCSAEALRRRAQPGYKPDGKPRYNTIKENGVVRFLRPTERIAPRRGGRPRLLDEPELRALHAAYLTGLSIRDLALQLLAAGHRGTESGLYQSMLYGWRNLELPIRSRPDAIREAHRQRGRIPPERFRRCAATRTRGKPCRQWARHGLATCWFHAEQETCAA
jgi:hypothetical protein